jgi:hypothetical protein
MVRIGAALDEALNARVFDLLVRLPLKTRTPGTTPELNGVVTRVSAD